MKKKLNWKIIIVIIIVGLALFIAYPPGEKIALGLDLQGGMHLVFQVMTNDAVNMETDEEITRIEEQLKKKDITFTSFAKGDPGKFTIQGTSSNQEGQIRDLLDQYFKEWNYTVFGDTVSLSMKPEVSTYLKDQAVTQAEETIRNRVDQFGVAEPTIQKQGSDRIVVELPGVDNPERVMNIIKTTAILEWKLVKAGPADTEEALLTDFGGVVPDDMEVIPSDPKRTQGGFYLVSRVATVTGRDLRTVRRSVDEWNNPAVSFTLNPDGGARFEQVTGENIGKPMAVILDGKVQTAPTIQAKILRNQGGIIQGRFTVEEAEDLVVILKAGALPATIKILENRTVGPSLGADSVRRGITASIAALILVLIFMVFYYRLAGVNAVTALVLNMVLLMGALAYFRATLTLPGIAGIILTIGMAVDANVLVFERIREELLSGKSVLSSIATGFSRAFRTILDANVTTIIAAIFLFQFGTGPIKGFAVTLIIGITASVFTAVFVSRLIFDISLTGRKKREKLSI